MFPHLVQQVPLVRLADFRSLRVVPLATLVALAACNVDSVTGPDLLSPSYARGGKPKPPPPPPPTITHVPILFVHGYNGSSSTWTTMYNRFQADGYTSAELVNWTYDYTKSNRTTAQTIKTKVDSILNATGATQVNLITHSMGTISVRYYIDSLGGASKVHAFAGLGAPHWDSYARGAILGITRGVTAKHLARAALESIAFQTWEVLHAMEKDSRIKIKELRVDGGASLNNFLMQFQADIIGVPVVRPKTSETTAWGAAALAGLAVGVWKDKKELGALWRVDQRFEPAMAPSTRDALLERWQEAVRRSKKWERPA